MKIILDREKCIGCGSCAALCPKYFQLAEDGKSKLSKGKNDPEAKTDQMDIDEIDCAKEAADACPVQAIDIKK